MGYNGIQERDGHSKTGLLTLVHRISDLGTGEKDTGLDFQAGDVIINAYVAVRTAEATAATKTIDVGLLSSESGGDTDGFLDGVATSAAAVVRGSLVGTDTVGVLLKQDTNGSSVFVPAEHVVASAVSLVYQLGSAHTELVADIIVRFFRPPVA